MSVEVEPDFSGDEVFIRRFPVHRACRDGDVGALLSLSNQAHLTAEDSCYGWTPIHWAAHYGQLECVVQLVQMGCEVNTVTSRFNQTPTHTAAFGGHPHCVVWLTQAGADVNKQDFVGEAPIHKAARSGSLECVQVLLIAGAKPHLRNASGQTAADLAHAHGFHDCFCFISNAQKHLQQLGGLHVNGAQNGGGAPCGQGLFSRKRQLNVADAGHMKKARRADGVLHIQSSAGEEMESMNTECAQELSTDDSAKTDRHHHILPSAAPVHPEPPDSRLPPSSPPVLHHPAASPQRPSADMCGSLHLTSSPTSCVSHRPACWGMMAADCVDSLRYGHYHGFGDTAEEVSDSSRQDNGGSSSSSSSSSIQAEHRCKQADHYHGS
ncbi:ankyrin repeat domain-containing protein 10-like isoform X2 [Stegastes partitus]|uniref:Ankyrin repeat domain-containing protein 10-like n=1 Tax=Stegastes partitus TaxID=144197 RepID=A0A3B5AFA6_9TELE|nr:PREDICTED: ankyrin repeat domain-containing protein 10-like isoform X2 [Stegastes partitus]